MQKSISIKGLSRIARLLTSQQQEMFDDPKLQERPREEIGRDQRRSEGKLPIPLSVKLHPSSSSGYTSPPDELDGNWDFDTLFGQPSMTFDEVADYILEEGSTDIREGLSPEEIATTNVVDVVELMRDHGIDMGGNTTYNWGWWGPDMAFNIIGPGAEEPYGECVLLIDFGTTAFPSHAYKLESYAEEAPWYDLRLSIVIETDEGTIRLDSEDTEAYRFSAYEDETGTWQQWDSFDYNELMEKLDWDSSELHDIW